MSNIQTACHGGAAPGARLWALFGKALAGIWHAFFMIAPCSWPRLQAMMRAEKLRHMSDTDHHTSASVPDWDRERPRRFWEPDRKLLRAIRAYQARADRGGLSSLTRRWWVLVHRFWSVVTQAEVHLNTQIGGGLRMPHPNGIVIHPDAVIGPNCTIMAQVTIGSARGEGVPRIGGHVDIGAGARILGLVTIGDHAQIGANAVVTKDVPEGCVAVGIPATVRAATKRPGGPPEG